MATPTQRGNDGPQLQYQTYTYDWHRGGTYSEEWRGLNASKMIAKWLGNVYIAQKAEMKIGQSMAELKLEWSGDTTGSGAANSLAVTIDRWEIPEPTFAKDILTHPQLIQIITSTIPGFGGLGLGCNLSQTYDVIAIMRQCIKAGQESASPQSAEKFFRDTLEDYLTAQGLTSPPTSVYSSTTFLNFFRLAINNQDHYQSSQYSLKHTTNVPNYWNLNVSDLNPNCIYSNPRFVAEVTDGSAWLLPLPGRLQYKLALAYSNFIALAPIPTGFTGLFQVGWLKGASSESTVGRGRIEIQTNYVLDQWSNTLYGSVT